jgi:hypothetical protein
MIYWKIILNGKLINGTGWDDETVDEAVKEWLISHYGFDPNIEIERCEELDIFPHRKENG